MRIAIVIMVIFAALVVVNRQTYNAGVRVGYDAVASAIGVTETKAIMIGKDVKITSKGIYHRQLNRNPMFTGVCGNCHEGRV